VSPNQYTEDALVQEPFARFLHEELGWESLLAFEETFGPLGTLGRDSRREVVLSRHLRAALEKLNPGLPESAYQDAIKRIHESSSSLSLLATNREKDKLLRGGVHVVFTNDKGVRDERTLRVFDFRNAHNNHFLAVREFWVKGPLHERRADLVGFVNGIPLVFMELKNLTKDVRAAYDGNFRDYLDVVPALFHHNVLVLLSNGHDAKVGSLSSKFEHFHEWKRLEEQGLAQSDPETLLRGICDQQNLLDLFENFIVFDESPDGVAKIVSRNHQFLGVNRAVQAVRERKERQGKLGVFWHTQGSGKSYSMAYLVRKVHQTIGGNFTFLILTDRDELDTQIYSTFAGCGIANNDAEPCRAASGEHLKTLLGQQKKVIFSLIQKFNQPVGEGQAYSLRDDIIVITDEAHRTQGGTLSLNLRSALPNASFMGFTGTPLIQGEEHHTRTVFGEYISTYDFQRAVEDNATVPLYYDARGEYLQVATSELNDRIAERLSEFDTQDVDVQQKLERELARDYHVFTAPKRLDQIAADFVEHYSTGWEGGKAMFVCIDKLTAVKMHGLIVEKWESRIAALETEIDQATSVEESQALARKLHWMRETCIAVIVSQEQGEVERFKKNKLDILPHRRLMEEGFPSSDGKHGIAPEIAFKQKDHPFRVAIVCAMWLTGFDVPTLDTLYIDKPLKAHTLMQAIARANRIASGKTNGLVVDYCGILKNLRSALATFAGQSDEGHGNAPTKLDPTENNRKLLELLQESLDLVEEFFAGSGFAFRDVVEQIQKASGLARTAILAKALVAALEVVNRNDISRKTFELRARAVFSRFQAAIRITPEIHRFRDARDVVDLIYKRLQHDRDRADISEVMEALRSIVDECIRPVQGGRDATPLYDISAIDFERLRKEFQSRQRKNTDVQDLKAHLARKLLAMLNRNPARIDFQQRYEEIVREYNSEHDSVTIEQTFEALLKFAQSLGAEESRALREGLTEETLALFDILCCGKDSLGQTEILRLKKVAKELLATLKAERLRVQHWRDREQTRDAVRQQIYDFLYNDTTGLPGAFGVEEVERLTTDVFLHVYRVYPEVPSPIYPEFGAPAREPDMLLAAEGPASGG
jgi:type I restriction enzyme, R subunit